MWKGVCRERGCGLVMEHSDQTYLRNLLYHHGQTVHKRLIRFQISGSDEKKNAWIIFCKNDRWFSIHPDQDHCSELVTRHQRKSHPQDTRRSKPEKIEWAVWQLWKASEGDRAMRAVLVEKLRNIKKSPRIKGRIYQTPALTASGKPRKKDPYMISKTVLELV